MSREYRCWDADNGNEPLALVVQAENWADAVDRFASRTYNSAPYDSMTVHVRTPSGALYAACVDVDIEISFGLSLKQRLERPLAEREVATHEENGKHEAKSLPDGGAA